MEQIIQKSAREIKVEDSISGNKNVSIKIGTVENRNNPSTIFINFSFWIKPKESVSNEEQSYLKKLINRELDLIHRNEVREFLCDSVYFPHQLDNIFIKTIPENINYNSKKNFISFELYLHTLNIGSEKKYPLNKKRNTELYTEAAKVSKIFASSDFLKGEKDFTIHKTSR